MSSLNVMSDNLSSFMGVGLLFTLLLICVLYLLICMKNSSDKHMLAWYPVYVLAIYFCPIWILYASLRDDSEILYRILWMIPMGIITVYTLVLLIYRMPAKYRIHATLLAIALIMFSGRFVYLNEFIQKAENIYHVPETVVKICDSIEVPGREVRACFPDEYIQYVRQYSPTVFLPYGREVFLEAGSREYYDLQEILNADTIDVERLVLELRNTECHFLVISEMRNIKDDIEKYDYSLKSVIDGYEIYVDNRAYLGL